MSPVWMPSAFCFHSGNFGGEQQLDDLPRLPVDHEHQH